MHMCTERPLNKKLYIANTSLPLHVAQCPEQNQFDNIIVIGGSNWAILKRPLSNPWQRNRHAWEEVVGSAIGDAW